MRLDLTDEEAVHYLQSLIEISASATMAGLMDQVHKIAQVSDWWTKWVTDGPSEWLMDQVSD